jgi:hypothetical protein
MTTKGGRARELLTLLADGTDWLTPGRVRRMRLLLHPERYEFA